MITLPLSHTALHLLKNWVSSDPASVSKVLRESMTMILNDLEAAMWLARPANHLPGSMGWDAFEMGKISRWRNRK
jgi:hypothetical protein